MALANRLPKAELHAMDQSLCLIGIADTLHPKQQHGTIITPFLDGSRQQNDGMPTGQMDWPLFKSRSAITLGEVNHKVADLVGAVLSSMAELR
jgi:hypothetical protein